MGLSHANMRSCSSPFCIRLLMSHQQQANLDQHHSRVRRAWKARDPPGAAAKFRACPAERNQTAIGDVTAGAALSLLTGTPLAAGSGFLFSRH
jgi:hypothetical protein